MLQGQETTQQGFLGGAEFSHLRAVLCPAQARRQGNHQEFRQIVLGRAVARITHVDPADPKRLHETLPFKPPDISEDIPESISYSSTSRSLLMCDSPAAQGVWLSLARALACHARGRGFESCHSRHLHPDSIPVLASPGSRRSADCLRRVDRAEPITHNCRYNPPLCRIICNMQELRRNGAGITPFRFGRRVSGQ